MPDMKEVYEMVTKQKPPETGALERQHTRQRRRSVRKKVGVFTVAAAIGLAAAALILVIRPEGGATTPANGPSTVNPSDAGAVQVATAFIAAYGTFDAETAISYLAEGADTSGWLGETPQDLRLNLSWWEASSYKQILDSCVETGSSDLGTSFHCTFVYHALRSDEVGLGPFSGSYFDLTVRDGLIVQGTAECEIEEFSPQMWEPFASWVSKAHPKDAAVMYTDDTYTEQRLTEESFGLWERHTKEYVKEARQGTAGQ